QIRRQSYEDYAWPRAFASAYRRNDTVVAFSITVCLALFLGLATGARPGPFYDVFPHRFLVTVFGAALAFAILAMTIGALRFRRAIASEASAGEGSPLVAALTLENLRGGGEGCYVRAGFDHPPETLRRWFHHFTVYGFLLCFASTVLGTF